MEKRKRYELKIMIILVIIIILQLIYKIYVDYTKEDFFIDEIYSYGLMNNEEAFIFDRDDFKNNWHSGQYFNNYLTINSEEVWNLSSVYNNQVEDVHPPLYYLLLRISATLTINGFTKWTGLILNLVIFTFGALMMFKIGKTLFKSQVYSLLLVTLYGFSLFSTQNTTFIRMYQLLELQLLMLVYWHLKNFNKDLTKLELLKLGILVITGFLTHYYYAVFAVGVYIVSMLQYIKEKQWKNILKYNVTLIVAGLLIIGIFPACLSHIFKGYRGKESINNFTYKGNPKKIWNRTISYLKIIKENMFNINVEYMIVGVLMLIPVILLKKRKLNDRIMYLVVPVLIYILIISKSSPFIDLRYVISIIVFIVILLVYLLKNGLQALVKDRRIVLTIMLVIVTIYSIPTLHNKKFEYIYYGNKEKIEKINQYKSIPCIYLYNDVSIEYNKFASNINYLRMFDNVYILNNDKIFYQDMSSYDTMSMREWMEFFNIDIDTIDINVSEILKDKDMSKGLIVFLPAYNHRIITYILEQTNFTKVTEIVKFKNSEAYLLH